MRMRRAIPKIAAALLSAVLIILSESSAYSFAMWILIPKGVLYRPPNIDLETFEKYLAHRDPALGWTSRANDIDSVGSRINTFFSTSSPACVSVYGDSFAYSSEVQTAHAWPNVLSKLLGCRVNNFGVGGYGTDQALLRYELNKDDAAERVLLVYQVENILRNVNQWRHLLYPATGTEASFKPIFSLSGARLKVHPPLHPNTIGEFNLMKSDPAAYLDHEYFIPNGQSGKRLLSFPFTWSILRSLQDYKMTAALRRVPGHFEFYNPEHPSSALLLTLLMLEEFTSQAQRRGQSPIIVFLPNFSELKYHQRSGYWSYSPLLLKAKGKRLPHIDLGPAISERLGSNDPCSIAKRPGKCHGHFNELGYTMIADLLFERLRN